MLYLESFLVCAFYTVGVVFHHPAHQKMTIGIGHVSNNGFVYGLLRNAARIQYNNIVQAYHVPVVQLAEDGEIACAVFRR